MASTLLRVTAIVGALGVFLPTLVHRASAQSTAEIPRETRIAMLLESVYRRDQDAKALEAKGEEKRAAEMRRVYVSLVGFDEREGDVLHHYAEIYTAIMTANDQKANAEMRGLTPRNGLNEAVGRLQQQRDSLERSEIQEFEGVLGGDGIRKLEAYFSPKPSQRLPMVALTGGVPPYAASSASPSPSVAPGVQLPAGKAPPRTAVAWQIVEPRLGLGEPVLLRLSVMNAGKDSIHVNLGAGGQEGVTLTIIGPDGRVLAPIARADRSGRDVEADVEGGTMYTHNFVINRLYDLDQPGDYIIRPALRYPAIAVGGSVASTAQELHVLIGPRDEHALGARLDELSRAVFTGKPGPVREEAVVILTSLRDPEAVRYVRRLLDVDDVRERAQEALDRISKQN